MDVGICKYELEHSYKMEYMQQRQIKCAIQNISFLMWTCKCRNVLIGIIALSLVRFSDLHSNCLVHNYVFVCFNVFGFLLN